MPEIDVVRTYLEMRDPAALRPARASDPAVRVARVDPCPTEHYRWLYRAVGEAYLWRDRDAWSDARLAAYLADPHVEVWELRVGDDVAGYVELRRHVEGAHAGETEIVYFGLVGRFHGRGLGKHLLTEAVERAWGAEPRPTRVWLHTCTLDGPAALPNYEARGFTRVRSETYREDVPADRVPPAAGGA